MLFGDGELLLDSGWLFLDLDSLLFLGCLFLHINISVTQISN